MAEEKKTEKPSWVKTKPEELKKLVIDLAKKGNSPAKIGLILRDKHAIPKTKILGKKITQILKESKVEYETETKRVEKNIKELKNHISKNKHDYPAFRSLTKQLWAKHHLSKKQQ